MFQLFLLIIIYICFLALIVYIIWAYLVLLGDPSYEISLFHMAALKKHLVVMYLRVEDFALKDIGQEIKKMNVDAILLYTDTKYRSLLLNKVS